MHGLIVECCSCRLKTVRALGLVQWDTRLNCFSRQGNETSFYILTSMWQISSDPVNRYPSLFSKGCRGLRHRVCSIDSYMMTSSNGYIFRVTGHLCGEFTGQRWIPAQRPVTPSFDVFFDLRLNKHLNGQSWGWWFETLSRPLWRHCNDIWIQGAACRPVLGLEGTVGWVCL